MSNVSQSQSSSATPEELDKGLSSPDPQASQDKGTDAKQSAELPDSSEKTHRSPPVRSGSRRDTTPTTTDGSPSLKAAQTSAAESVTTESDGPRHDGATDSESSTKGRDKATECGVALPTSPFLTISPLVLAGRPASSTSTMTHSNQFHTPVCTTEATPSTSTDEIGRNPTPTDGTLSPGPETPTPVRRSDPNTYEETEDTDAGPSNTAGADSPEDLHPELKAMARAIAREVTKSPDSVDEDKMEGDEGYMDSEYKSFAKAIAGEITKGLASRSLDPATMLRTVQPSEPRAALKGKAKSASGASVASVTAALASFKVLSDAHASALDMYARIGSAAARASQGSTHAIEGFSDTYETALATNAMMSAQGQIRKWEESPVVAAMYEICVSTARGLRNEEDQEDQDAFGELQSAIAFDKCRNLTLGQYFSDLRSRNRLQDNEVRNRMRTDSMAFQSVMDRIWANERKSNGTYKANFDFDPTAGDAEPYSTTASGLVHAGIIEREQAKKEERASLLGLSRNSGDSDVAPGENEPPEADDSPVQVVLERPLVLDGGSWGGEFKDVKNAEAAGAAGKSEGSENDEPGGDGDDGNGEKDGSPGYRDGTIQESDINAFLSSEHGRRAYQDWVGLRHEEYPAAPIHPTETTPELNSPRQITAESSILEAQDTHIKPNSGLTNTTGMATQLSTSAAPQSATLTDAATRPGPQPSRSNLKPSPDDIHIRNTIRDERKAKMNEYIEWMLANRPSGRHVRLEPPDGPQSPDQYYDDLIGMMEASQGRKGEWERRRDELEKHAREAEYRERDQNETQNKAGVEPLEDPFRFLDDGWFRSWAEERRISWEGKAPLNRYDPRLVDWMADGMGQDVRPFEYVREMAPENVGYSFYADPYFHAWMKRFSLWDYGKASRVSGQQSFQSATKGHAGQQTNGDNGRMHNGFSPRIEEWSQPKPDPFIFLDNAYFKQWLDYYDVRAKANPPLSRDDPRLIKWAQDGVEKDVMAEVETARRWMSQYSFGRDSNYLFGNPFMHAWAKRFNVPMFHDNSYNGGTVMEQWFKTGRQGDPTPPTKFYGPNRATQGSPVSRRLGERGWQEQLQEEEMVKQQEDRALQELQQRQDRERKEREERFRQMRQQEDHHMKRQFEWQGPEYMVPGVSPTMLSGWHSENKTSQSGQAKPRWNENERLSTHQNQNSMSQQNPWGSPTPRRQGPQQVLGQGPGAPTIGFAPRPSPPALSYQPYPPDMTTDPTPRWAQVAASKNRDREREQASKNRDREQERDTDGDRRYDLSRLTGGQGSRGSAAPDFVYAGSEAGSYVNRYVGSANKLVERALEIEMERQRAALGFGQLQDQDQGQGQRDGYQRGVGSRYGRPGGQQDRSMGSPKKSLFSDMRY